MVKNLHPLAAIPALLLTACGAEPDPAPPPDRTRVATVTVQAATSFETAATYTGRVEARLESGLGFEIPGALAAVSVAEGQTVRTGDALARLDTARLDARREEAGATLARAEANVELARSTLTRTVEAYGYEGVSAQQLDEARQRVSALASAREAAHARLRTVAVDLEKSVLRAPFDGVVVARLADPGQILAAGQRVLQLQSSSAPEARIGLARDAAATLAPGDVVSLTINGVAAAARTIGIVPRRDEATRTQDVIFELESGEHRPGDLARLELATTVEAPGYRLPLTAITDGPRGLWQALVAVRDAADGHVLEARTLEVLHTDGRNVYVRGEIRTGDEVVVDGLHRVVAGQRVTAAARSALADARRDRRNERAESRHEPR